MDEESKLEESF